MKRVLLFIPILMLFLGSSFLSSKTGIEVLQPQQFKLKVDEGKLTLIDVRTPKEFASGHLKGAINIDYYSADFKNKIMKYQGDDAILIYCQSGGRSGAVSRKLSQNGFAKIYDLAGGLNAYTKAGFKLAE